MEVWDALASATSLRGKSEAAFRKDVCPVAAGATRSSKHWVASSYQQSIRRQAQLFPQACHHLTRARNLTLLEASFPTEIILVSNCTPLSFQCSPQRVRRQTVLA